MFMKAIMNEQGIPMDGSWEGWIGLYYDRNADNTPNPDPDADPDDNKNSVKWRWTDRHPVTYTSWGKNQPQPNSNAKGCVVINGNGGWYVTDTCDAAKPYLCKLDASHNPDEHEDPGEDICLDEEISYKGYCYQRSSGYYTFEDAEKRCAELMGAKVSLKDQVQAGPFSFIINSIFSLHPFMMIMSVDSLQVLIDGMVILGSD